MTFMFKLPYRKYLFTDAKICTECILSDMFSYYGDKDNPWLQIVCRQITDDNANNNLALYNSDTFCGTSMSKSHGKSRLGWVMVMAFEWKYY